MRVKSCELLHARVSLSKPYILSFTTVSAIDSVVVRIVLDNGAVGIGEAVPLPGYSCETVESIVADSKDVLPRIVGANRVELLRILDDEIASSPFVRSAIYSAWELASAEVSLLRTIELPLLTPLASSRNPITVLEHAMAKYELGYRTFKLKVGRDFEADILTCPFLLDNLPEDVKVRIDANQSYSIAEARELLRVVEHKNCHLIELLEQPFGVAEGDWDLFWELAKETDHVPLMLDESIILTSDIDRAAEVGADLVKLKLFKHRGIHELIALAKKARRNGMGVVLGNGVSSEIGNLIEAHAFQEAGVFQGAFEGNGFAKLSHTLLDTRIVIDNGSMCWEPSAGCSFSALLKDAVYTSVLREEN